MSFQSRLIKITAITLTVMLSACATPPETAPPQVQLADDIAVTLPLPEQLGYALTASQLINATWHTSSSQRSEQLPVQLQVNEKQVVLAGFSSWGTRILSLDYQAQSITTDVLAGLKGVLPQPEQVLFNLMITLWPSSAWEAPLNKVRWQLVDDEYSRAIFDSQGQKVIDIQYSSEEKLAGDIRFHQLSDDYLITIKTLHYSKAPLTP